MSPRVFLITGCSAGFGEELVKVVLAGGDIAVATARKPETLKFDGTNAKNYLSIRLDVTDESSIEEAFGKALDTFGRVDVVVNNAGYGLSGEFEGLPNDKIRAQFDVNFFGVLSVTRKALQVMREQKPSGGVIQQVTSIGGLNGVPSFSIYCATKFAVEGFTEALSKEIKPEWNIKLTNIEPGGFRTEWSNGDRSMVFGDRHPAYDHMNSRENAKKRDKTQAGDPTKAAKAMYDLSKPEVAPIRVILGSDSYEILTKRLDDHKKSVEEYKKYTLSTDVDEK